MVLVESISKYYGTHKAVDSVSLELHHGEIVGLLGVNGAGKSTVLGVLSGTMFPSSGEVYFNNCALTREPEKFRADIGFLPETLPLYESMSPEETLRYAGELRGLSRREAARRGDELLDDYGLKSLRSIPVNELSRGQRQRVGIAQALVHQPSLLILDEPASGLDPVQLLEFRQRLSAMRGVRTVLVSSHHLAEAQAVCDRFILLRQGKLLAQGFAKDMSAESVAQLLVNATRREVA